MKIFTNYRLGGLLAAVAALVLLASCGAPPTTVQTEDARLKRMLRAAETGYKAGVRNELNWGVDVNARDDRGRTALHYAAECGHDEMVRLLIGEGANVNVRDHQGNTPLALAEVHSHQDTSAELKAAGAR